jgi:hypothetical protein
MALYQHDLYLVRADRSRPLLGALRDRGLVRDAEVGEGVVLPGGARALVEAGRLRTGGGTTLQVTALLIEDEDVGLFTRDFDAVVSWLEDTARAMDLLVAFMPGGPDASSGAAGLEPFLTALLDEGRVETAHALVWFASSVADGAPCDVVNPPYRTVRVPGLGCLFALVDVAPDGSFEILEPGPDRAHLLSAWSTTHR